MQEIEITDLDPDRPCCPTRSRLTFLLFLANAIAAMDQGNLSVCIILMAPDFGWTMLHMGWLLSAFFYGYAASHILGIFLTRRFGAKAVALSGMLFWSVCCALTPVCAPSFAACLMIRAGVGVGQGMALGTTQGLLSAWLPQQERARGLAITITGQMVGVATALLVSPLLARWWHWRLGFYFWAGVAFLWVLIFWREGASSPRLHPRISQSELVYIHSKLDAERGANLLRNEAPRRGDTGGQGVNSGSGEYFGAEGVYSSYHDRKPALAYSDSEVKSPRSSNESETSQDFMFPRSESGTSVRTYVTSYCIFLQSSPTLAIICAHAAFSVGHVTALCFLPLYFHTRWDHTMASSAVLALPTWAAMATMAMASFYLAQFCISRRAHPRWVRRVMQCAAFLIPLPVFWAASVASLQGADVRVAVWLALGFGLSGASVGGCFSNMADVARASVPALSALSRAIAAVVGMVVPPIVAVVVGTGEDAARWDVVALVVLVVFVIGAVVFLLAARGNARLP